MVIHPTHHITTEELIDEVAKLEEWLRYNLEHSTEKSYIIEYAHSKLAAFLVDIAHVRAARLWIDMKEARNDKDLFKPFEEVIGNRVKEEVEDIPEPVPLKVGRAR